MRACRPVHVGIHAGPLIVRDGDVYGHTVNVASRVGATAGPGEVVVTTEVVVWSRDLTSVTFESIGPAVLKGVTEPLALHRVARQPHQPDRAPT